MNTAGSRQIRMGRAWRTLVLIAAIAAAASPAIAADGALDSTFGIGGKVVTDFLGHDRGTSIVVQPDGKLVVAGAVDNASFQAVLGVARYNPDGSLDSTFGTGGKASFDFFPIQTTPSEREGVAVALQADGRIVVAGTLGDPYTFSDFGVVRLNPDGTVDTTFGGGDGWVSTDFGGPADQYPTGDGAAAVAIQKDGKIVAAGFARVNGSYSDFAIARYDADGSLDSSFGGGTGKVTVDFLGTDDFANGVAIQADGKIVAAGVSSDVYHRSFGVIRLAADGSLDSSFGPAANGRIRTVLSEWDQANAVVIQPADGKIVVGGFAVINVVGGPASYFDFALIRYNPDGSLDGSFGTGGVVTTDLNGEFDQANALALQADGKIVAAGSHSYLSNVETHVDFMVVRYTPDGVPDATFGTDGIVLTAFDGVDVAQGVAIQGGCKIVAAGYTWPVFVGPWGEEFDYNANFALARYDAGECSTPPPAYRCPLSQGYWNGHPANWPVTSLVLGIQSYNKTELLNILAAPTNGDASLILAQQLIAAKLNLATGSDPGPIANVISDADTLLSGFAGKLAYKVKSSSAIGKQMIAVAKILESYNLGQLTPGCTP